MRENRFEQFGRAGDRRRLAGGGRGQVTIARLGVAIGFVTEALRKLIKSRAAYKKFVETTKVGFATDFMLDSALLPSPYASSFGGFVNLLTSAWLAAGGVLASAIGSMPKSKDKPAALPEDMSTASLVGGGLIAGDALAALGLGIAGLLATVLG